MLKGFKNLKGSITGPIRPGPDVQTRQKLIPEGFLPATIFPFSPSTQIGLCTGNPIPIAHQGLPTNDELLQQMLPGDCFWLAPVLDHSGVSNLADNPSNYAAFLDYSHRLNQREWLHPGKPIPQEFQTAIIEQPGTTFLFHENSCTILDGQHDRNNYTESSCSSSSAGSESYSCKKPRLTRDQINQRESTSIIVNEPAEPQNLSARTVQNSVAEEELIQTIKVEETEDPNV